MRQEEIDIIKGRERCPVWTESGTRCVLRSNHAGPCEMRPRRYQGFPWPTNKNRIQELRQAYSDAAGDIHNMINDLPAPESRDYPATSRYGDPWKVAVQAHVDRITKLQEVERELREIAEDLADQLDGR